MNKGVRMNYLNRILAIMLLLAGSSSFAYNYGMAGCGLGSMAFRDQPGKIQIVAALLNHFVVPQTSAISTGTSNCTEVSSADVANQYIESNSDSLKKDIAQGSGETLKGLLTLWGCGNVEKVGANLQSNFQQIYDGSDNNVELGTNLKKVIRQNNTNSCTTLI